jgi:hypothetical protein
VFCRYCGTPGVSNFFEPCRRQREVGKILQREESQQNERNQQTAKNQTKARAKKENWHRAAEAVLGPWKNLMVA